MALAYLFEPTTQFQARTGSNLTAGFLRVYYSQTDDAAPTYSDFAATPNEELIVLDADGRAVVIVDDSKTYRLEVYNRNQGLLFTVDPLTAVGGAGGSMAYRVISSDGTVAVGTTTAGGVIYYDLSTAISEEASKWGSRECSIGSLDGSDDWQELQTDSFAGSVIYYYGWKATKDTGYDFSASVELPAGIDGAIYGIDVKCEFLVDGVAVATETGYIDPTLNVDRVSFEYKGQVDKGQKVDARLYARCAQALTGTLVGRAFYNEECDGVVGGGGGGSEYFPGEYVDISTANVISVTGVQPLSGMSAYATQSAVDGCCSAMSGYVSALSSDVSAISAQVSAITGLTGDYVQKSSISAESAQWNNVSAKLDSSAFTSYTATALTGIQQDTADISAHVSGLTGQYVEKSAISAESAQWNEVSAKLDKSASSNFYTTANESGYVDSAYVESQVSGKQDSSAMTAYQPAGDYAYNSAVSAKLDKSASSNFYLNSNPSAFISGVTTDSSMTGDGSVASPLGIERVDMVFDSSMKTSVSGDSAVIGVNESALNLSSYQRVSAMTAYQPVSGMSAYQLSGDYYSASNPSGFITGVDLSPFAYQSSLSSKLDASASSSFLPASSSADLFTGVHTDSSLTGNGLSSSPLGVERVDLVFTSGITTSISGDSALVYLDSSCMRCRASTTLPRPHQSSPLETISHPATMRTIRH